MKQKERRHLKENKLAQGVVSARDFVELRRRQLTMALGGVVIVAVVAAGVVLVRQQSTSTRLAALAEAMVVMDTPVEPPTPALPATGGRPATPETQAIGTYPTEEAKLHAALPKLQEAADADPDSNESLMARYYLASTLASLGRHEGAISEYEKLISRGGESVYAQMARLGKANEQARLGEYPEAIATYQELADQPDSTLPTDAILMQLAAAYDASGNAEEAKKAFSRVVHEHPASPYSTDAGKHLE